MLTRMRDTTETTAQVIRTYQRSIGWRITLAVAQEGTQ
jgi:hypothetical protein